MSQNYLLVSSGSIGAPIVYSAFSADSVDEAIQTARSHAEKIGQSRHYYRYHLYETTESLMTSITRVYKPGLVIGLASEQMVLVNPTRDQSEE